jgi:hypothetical protein
MGLRMTKPWQELTSDALRQLPGQLGVFELADEDGVVRRIGYAGARELFGVRSALEPFVGRYRSFRWECTTAYLTRWQELMMVHKADHGALPADNPEPPGQFGRLSVS